MTRHPVKRKLVGAVLLIAAAVVGGCAGPKAPVSKSVITSMQGSVLYGTFVPQGEAQLSPTAPVAEITAVGDAVYVYTDSQMVYGLSQGLDIRFLKQIIPPTENLRKPVQVGDEVIFPSTIGLVVTNKIGEPVREVKLPHPLSSEVQVDQRGLLLAGVASLTGGRVAVIDPTRTVRPTRQEVLLGNVTSKPVSLQGVIYAATSDGKVFAVGEENRTAWPLAGMSFETNRPIKADLVIDDYAVYVASGDSTLYALDRTTGKIRWRYMAEQPLDQTPLVTKDRVYQIVPDRGLVALSKTDGKLYREPLWTAEGVTKVVSADDKYVYGVRGKTIVAIGIADGQERFSASGRFDYVIAGADDSLFAATKDGAVVKLKRGPYTGDAVAGR